MSLMSNVIQSSSYMHIHNFTGGMTPCSRYTVSTGYFVMKCCKITYPPPSLPPSSGHTGLLRLRLSFSLPSLSASRLQASLACLASACSAAVCSRLRSHSFSSLDFLASGRSAALHSWSQSHRLSTLSYLVPLLCVCDHTRASI